MMLLEVESVNLKMYCGLMTQSEWPERLTKVIAREVRRYRNQRKMSAKVLSDCCAKLGMEISRSTLADLENGRRASLTFAEVLILAAALDVPLVTLAFAVGQQEDVEVL